MRYSFFLFAVASLGAPLLFSSLLAQDGGAVLLKDPAAGIDCADASPCSLNTGAKLFSNRDYLAEEIPEELSGLTFYCGKIEGLHAVCQKAGMVYVVTPSPGRSPDSLASSLLKQGFEKSDLSEFLLMLTPFGGDDQNRCSTYQKKVAVGEELNLGKWGVLVVPAKN